MKGLVRLVVLVVIALGAFNYMEYQKTGQMPARDWLAKLQHAVVPAAQKAIHNVTAGDASDDGEKRVKISKWTDANGVVHYENRPVEGAQTLEVDPDTNVVPLAPIAEVPASEDTSSKPKTMNEEMHELREAKQAQMESIINR